MPSFYAYVEVREWGEPDREQRIGPFTVEDEAELRENLERQGDFVNHIERIDETEQLRWAVCNLKAVPTGGPTLTLAGRVATLGPEREPKR
jgi:hypothetical protein